MRVEVLQLLIRPGAVVVAVVAGSSWRSGELRMHGIP